MMRRRALLITLLLSFQVAGLFADVATVTLKNGQVLTGAVTAETDKQIALDVPANKSGTIMTSKIIAKTDIEKIERETAEQKASRLLAEDYRDTQKYQLTDTSFPQEYYDRVIDGSFRPFLIKHPDSTYTNDVTLKIAAWTAERDKVATGATKRDGQWVDAAASNTSLEEAQISRFLKAGDRLLAASQFYAAVMEYRDALTVTPLTASALDQIAQKVAAVAKVWKTEVTGGVDFSGTMAQLYDAQNRRLLPQRVELQKAVEQLQLIASAKAVEVRPGVQHWIAENPGHTPARYDFGRMMPDAKAGAAELQKDQAALRKLDETITANNALIRKPQNTILSATVRLRNIDTILQQVADDLAQARTESQKAETEAAQKNSAQPTPDTSSNQVAAAAATPPPAEPFSIVAWCKANWIWLAAGAVVIVYDILRRLDH